MRTTERTNSENDDGRASSACSTQLDSVRDVETQRGSAQCSAYCAFNGGTQYVTRQPANASSASCRPTRERLMLPSQTPNEPPLSNDDDGAADGRAGGQPRPTTTTTKPLAADQPAATLTHLRANKQHSNTATSAEQTNERTHKRTNERTNEQTNERREGKGRNERTNEPPASERISE